jgi:hypothetical protein
LPNRNKEKNVPFNRKIPVSCSSANRENCIGEKSFVTEKNNMNINQRIIEYKTMM